MFEWIRDFLRRAHARKRPARKNWIEGSTGTPVEETEEGKLFAIIGGRGICPDCSTRGFIPGPRGGMSQNIYCKNSMCRSAFNLTRFTPSTGIVQRIGKADPAIYENLPVLH